MTADGAGAARSGARGPGGSTSVGALTSFVGRRAEIEQALAALAAARLVTVTGTGGVGETRLALEIVEEVAGDYPDGVHVVELTTLQPGDDIAPSSSIGADPW